MKASELRIGNYVLLDDKGVYQIDSGHDIEEIDSFPFDNPYCQGVPLTEQWLKDFGFKPRGAGFLINTNRITALRLDSTSFILDENTRFYVTLHHGKDIVHSKKIKYVHQLQNLYFALTGEELKLKNESN